MISTKHLVAALSFALLAGCYAAAADGTGSGSGSNGGSSGTTGGTAGDGLPCDVQNVLAKNCWECHGETPSQKAPNSLITFDQLSKYADEAISRMKDGSMPPGGGVSADDIAVIENWVKGGKQQSSCDSGPSTDTGPDLFAVAPQCTTNQFWPKSSNRESPLMHPGRACIDCHDSGEGPSLSVAGTAYPTGHEPDDCNSKTMSGAKVQVLDANKKVVAEATVNSVGNFYISTRTLARIPTGGHVQIVTTGGAVRAMADTPKSGDCNSCHTQSGTNDAPGRVVFPAQ